MTSVVTRNEPAPIPRLLVMAGTRRNHHSARSRECIEYVASIIAPRSEIRYLLDVAIPGPLRLFRLFQAGVEAISVFVVGLANIRRGDVVLAMADPPGAQLVAALASLIRGASYTVIWFGAPGAKAGRPENVSNPLKIQDYFDRWVFKHAARIIVERTELSAIAEKKTARLDIPIVLMPECLIGVESCDDSHYAPLLLEKKLWVKKSVDLNT